MSCKGLGASSLGSTGNENLIYIEAFIITYTVFFWGGGPYYNYGRRAPKTLF